MKPQFNILFRGEILPGHDVLQVKRKLASLYKVSEDKLEPWFSGQTITIKECVDHATAKKYKEVFDNVGAICILQKLENNKEPRSSSPSPPQKETVKRKYKVVFTGEIPITHDKIHAQQLAAKIKEFIKRFGGTSTVHVNIADGHPQTRGNIDQAKSLMICPQCGFEQPESEMCGACGIVIQKYLDRKKIRILSTKET